MNQFKVTDLEQVTIPFHVHTGVIIGIIISLVILIAVLILITRPTDYSMKALQRGEFLVVLMLASTFVFSILTGNVISNLMDSGKHHQYRFESVDTYKVASLEIINDDPTFTLRNQKGHIINESFKADHGVITIEPGKEVRKGDTVRLISEKITVRDKPKDRLYTTDELTSDEYEVTLKFESR